MTGSDPGSDSDAADNAADDGGDPRTAELARRLAEVRERLERARSAAGRADRVDLVVVTKFHPAADVVRLCGLGVDRVGENRAQEAAAKRLEVARAAGAAAPRWDMIGHLQSNKAASVAGWADRVQSVDSVKVARGLDRGRSRAVEEELVDGPLPVLLQLGLDGDESRGGIGPDGLAGLAEEVAGLSSLRLDGLMVVPPLHGSAARHLATAAAHAERLRADHPGSTVFSAGMSGDLEEAVAAGSTCVRVGTAILGPRPIA